MKLKALFIAGFVSFGMSAQSTTELVLNIDHRMGQNPLTSSEVGTNNLGNQFIFSRLQYYVDDIQVEYNSDSIFEYPHVLLINALEDETRLHLGSVTDLDSVTAIRFAVGVGPDVNNLDPSTYPPAHPLAPKSPSMHWGWTSGYRFVCAEGLGSSSFDQVFELHGLGNDNYAMQTIATSGTALGGDTIEVGLIADYSELVKNIHVAQGVTSHGETGDAFQALKNLNNDVFTSAAEGNAAMGEIERELSSSLAVEMYPNPTSGSFAVNAPKSTNISVYDALGNLLAQHQSDDNPVQIELSTAGMYLVQFSHEGTTTVQKLMVR